MFFLPLSFGFVAGLLLCGKRQCVLPADAPRDASPPHVLRGRLTPCHPARLNGAPAGYPPQPGVRSVPETGWCYELGPDETVGQVARGVVGDDGRYQELMLANSTMRTRGTAGVYSGPSAWEPERLDAGERLRLPEPWSEYVDQVGRPRGHRLPWPRDGRRPVREALGATVDATAATYDGGHDRGYDPSGMVAASEMMTGLRQSVLTRRREVIK